MRTNSFIIRGFPIDLIVTSQPDGTYCEHGREIFDEEVDTPAKGKEKSKKYVSKIYILVKDYNLST